MLLGRAVPTSVFLLKQIKCGKGLKTLVIIIMQKESNEGDDGNYCEPGCAKKALCASVYMCFVVTCWVRADL